MRGVEFLVELALQLGKHLGRNGFGHDFPFLGSRFILHRTWPNARDPRLWRGSPVAKRWQKPFLRQVAAGRGTPGPVGGRTGQIGQDVRVGPVARHLIKRVRNSLTSHAERPHPTARSERGMDHGGRRMRPGVGIDLPGGGHKSAVVANARSGNCRLQLHLDT